MRTSAGTPASTAQKTSADLHSKIKEVAFVLLPDRPNHTRNQFFRDGTRAGLECHIHYLLAQIPNSACLSMDEILETMEVFQAQGGLK